MIVTMNVFSIAAHKYIFPLKAKPLLGRITVCFRFETCSIRAALREIGQQVSHFVLEVVQRHYVLDGTPGDSTVLTYFSVVAAPKSSSSGSIHQQHNGSVSAHLSGSSADLGNRQWGTPSGARVRVRKNQAGSVGEVPVSPATAVPTCSSSGEGNGPASPEHSLHQGNSHGAPGAGPRLEGAPQAVGHPVGPTVQAAAASAEPGPPLLGRLLVLV